MFQRTTAVNKLGGLKQRIRVVPGGTWAGKTYVILALEINYCIKHEGTQSTAIAETVPSIKSGALKDFKEIMRETGRWDSNRFNATDRIYTFSNGSNIQFTAYENEDKAKQSGKRNRLFVNEANTIPKPIVDALIIRTDGVIWLDYNPTARFWVNDEFENHKGVDWVTLTYKDNEALPNTILEELSNRRDKAKTSSYWANWCKVYLDGQIGTLEGVCIPDWKKVGRLPEDEDGNLECRVLCYGLDFGYSNDPTSLVAVYKWNDSYIFDEIIYKKGLLNSEISDLLKSNKVKGNIYADSAEPKSIQELKLRGHKIYPCTKGRDSIVYGIELINQNEIYITSNSTNLIKELQSYTWKVDKAGEKMNKPVDAFNHAIDAIRYALSETLMNPNKGEYYIH
tara:strand:+ start:417 stop:1604 length:1188 start_codon:yes stop_codon:yes gene_type:complete